MARVSYNILCAQGQDLIARRFAASSPKTMTDGSKPSVSELIEKARLGDDAMRDRLFEACRNYLAVVARAQVGSWLRAKADASDLVQQTMLEAHRDFDRFRGGSEAEWLAWLRKILAHNAADFVRRYAGTAKRAVGREITIDRCNDRSTYLGRLEPVARDETPSKQMAQLDRQFQVADALSELSADHQEVIMLRNLQRLPFDEIADRMDRSRPAVQMLWMRAIKKLEKTLSSTDVADDS